jgi:hypothetical protein
MAPTGRAFVQPAFDDHGGAGEAEARHRPQRDPRRTRDDEQVEQDGDRRQRSERAVTADVTDATNRRRDDQAAGDETARPAGAEECQLDGREPGEGAADGEQEAVQPARHEQEARAEKQRGDGNELGNHARDLASGDESWATTRTRCRRHSQWESSSGRSPRQTPGVRAQRSLDRDQRSWTRRALALSDFAIWRMSDAW